jgi:hypothetical protein
MWDILQGQLSFASPIGITCTRGTFTASICKWMHMLPWSFKAVRQGKAPSLEPNYYKLLRWHIGHCRNRNTEMMIDIIIIFKKINSTHITTQMDILKIGHYWCNSATQESSWTKSPTTTPMTWFLQHLPSLPLLLPTTAEKSTQPSHLPQRSHNSSLQ